MAPYFGKQTQTGSAARAQRARALRRATVIVIAAALVPSVGLISFPDHRVGAAGAESTKRVASPAQVRLTIRPQADSTPVPRSFFGLSTEYWTLPVYTQHPKLFERVLSLLRVRGGGPLILRIGGDSADHTRWDPRTRGVPPWVLSLTPRWLSRTRTLVRHLALRLILDLNVATGSPAAAANWARAAERGLPLRSIAGFEIGNEPDVFDRTFQVAALARRPGPRMLPRPISVGTYVRDFEAYAGALASAAPHVPLLGPALASPSRAVSWMGQLLAGPHPSFRALSAHSYPYSGCANPRSSRYPTISRLLNMPAAWARTIGAAAVRAHRAGLEFRLTELNSVDCGGLRGVSNTFATALWAPDALFQLLRAGVDGVNLHVRAYPINAPFWLDGTRLRVRPLLYGLTLFARTLGSGARLLPLALHGQHPAELKAWAVSLRDDVLHVLILDKARQGAALRLRLPSTGRATVQRLLAPSVAATSGVTLAGQQIGPDGRWHGRWHVQYLRPSARGYPLEMPGTSAALVTVHVH